jgi:hypothetical protein
VHYHGGKQNAELREALKDWFSHVGALHPVTPPTTTAPTLAEIAILLPRCEVAPVTLARYLLSSVSFALLMPVDLLAMASHPNVFRQSPHTEVAARFAKAGKVTILATPSRLLPTPCRATPAPVTGFGYHEAPDEQGRTQVVLGDHEFDEVEGTVPRTLEAWACAQKLEPRSRMRADSPYFSMHAVM